MSNKGIVFSVLFLMVLFHSSAGILDRIQRSIEKGDFEKSERLIRRSLERDSLNTGAKYYFSILFLEPSYSLYHIDSAHYYIERSLQDFKKATVDMLEDLTDLGINVTKLEEQHARVAAAAFDRAKKQMTVKAFDRFLAEYEGFDEVQLATYKRDSLAFGKAADDDTWQAYQEFFTIYTDSEFSVEARERYQRLIFSDYTQDDRLASYVTFLRDHPDTPFRRLAEKIILERSTVRNDWDSYWRFVQNYPDSYLKKKVMDILYYQAKTDFSERLQDVFRMHPASDSVQNAFQLEQQVLFPINQDKKFGFMSLDGEEVISPTYPGILSDYLCGNITNEWLQILDGRERMAVTRSGAEILKGVGTVREVSPSIKLVELDNNYLYHSAGFRISELSVEEARTLSNGWIAFRHQYDWGIVSPVGYQLLPPAYESIEMKGAFIVLESDGQYAFTSVDELADLETPVKPDFRYDDYELVNDTIVQAYAGDWECLIDHHLDEVIPLGQHQIFFDGAFWYLKEQEGYRILSEDDLVLGDQVFEQINLNSGWFAFRKPEGWLLISRNSRSVLAMNQLDSVKLLSAEAAFAQRGDTLQLLFQNGQKIPVTSEHQLMVLGNQYPSTGNQANYLQINLGNQTSLYNGNGEAILDDVTGELSLLSDSLFRIRYRGKTGLINAQGDEVLPTEYDVMDEKDGLIFLLKDGKIGCLDVSRKVLLPTAYESRVSPFGSYYEVMQGGKKGIVDGENEWILPAQYDQVLYWNDTSSWVRDDTGWALVNLKEERAIYTGVISVRPWLNLEAESLAIVLGEDGHGLMSTTRGELLPMEYNDIINVGAADQPVFFAEQHLKTAAFYVVTYLDLSGATIRSQAFRPEEYELIYCDQ